MRKYGYQIITVDKYDSATAMNEIFLSSLPYISASVKDECLKLKILSRYENAYKKLFNEKNIIADFGQSKGFFAKASKYFKRYGFIVGIFLMLLFTYLSSLFVWRIDIEGNYSIEDAEIIELLEKSGVSLGTFIPTINYDDVHNRFLLNSNDIAWISVNITGNVAKVSVREKMPENHLEDERIYTNVVAKSDAQIYQIRLIHGRKVVSVGDIVKKGDLLVSGVMSSQSQGVIYTNAKAEILAYVNKEIKIKVPFKTTEKIYNNKEFTEKSFKIFTNSINFSLKYRNRGALYDTIEARNKVYLFNQIELPIEILSKTYREYYLVEKTLSYQEAVDSAFYQLNAELNNCLSNAELISKSVETSWDDECFYISCKVYCIEDIAKLLEFQIN